MREQALRPVEPEPRPLAAGDDEDGHRAAPVRVLARRRQLVVPARALVERHDRGGPNVLRGRRLGRPLELLPVDPREPLEEAARTSGARSSTPASRCS